MPYRTAGPGGDAPVMVMLVTSRGTGRWVLPKGNVEPGVAPHVAAAMEAEEEAGVRGRINRRTIGTYRYRKQHDDGSSTVLDVDVYPMAVTEELADWKESAERERQWFPLAQAAFLVDEADLADLLASFVPPRRAPGARWVTWLRGLMRRA